MINGIRLLLLQLLCCPKSRADLQAENLMLRHQIGVLRRSTSKRVRTTRIDRLSFVWLYRLWPASIGAVQIIHPNTLVRWHRQGFRAYWRRKSRSHGGRPKVSAELGHLFCDKQTKSTWGAPRIHGELLKLGFNVSQATVSRYLPRRPRDPDQRWKAFLSNHRHCVASIDFLVVPTASFKLLFVPSINSIRRRIPSLSGWARSVESCERYCFISSTGFSAPSEARHATARDHRPASSAGGALSD